MSDLGRVAFSAHFLNQYPGADAERWWQNLHPDRRADFAAAGEAAAREPLPAGSRILLLDGAPVRVLLPGDDVVSALEAAAATCPPGPRVRISGAVLRPGTEVGERVLSVSEPAAG